jgi:hypothetical protein
VLVIVLDFPRRSAFQRSWLFLRVTSHARPPEKPRFEQSLTLPFRDMAKLEIENEHD